MQGSKYRIDKEGRQCIDCKDYKPWNNFYKSTTTKIGYGNLCKPCDKISTDVSRKKYPERYKRNYDNYRKRDPERWRKHMRKWLLKSKYGMTLEQYDEMLTLQGNKCAICGRLDSGRRRDNGSFLVDHNHETDAVRGLLCYPCNISIGLLRDDSSIMKKMVNYMEMSSSLSIKIVI